MSNTVLRQSPFVYTPLKMTVNEGNRSHTRIDENFKPYTVIDVLTKVYNRSFYDDLRLLQRNIRKNLISQIVSSDIPK